MVETFTGANFTGFLHQRFRFQTLGSNGGPCGPSLTGDVQRIYRSAGHLCVDLYIPAKKCTHTYFARSLYYKGPGGGRRKRNDDQ